MPSGRGVQVQGPVGSASVAVLDVLSEHAPEVSLSDDQPAKPLRAHKATTRTPNARSRTTCRNARLKCETRPHRNVKTSGSR